jgi:excinuclease ABC subunit A
MTILPSEKSSMKQSQTINHQLPTVERSENILVKGARVHNLKNIDVEIPRNQLTVITGLSGSGKSSLAFDTIHAEGQRRYVETLSAYARQFLGTFERPDVDDIQGLSPSISIEQKVVSHNPRSTVGTVTGIYDFLRVLFARSGTQFCVNCDKEVSKQSADEIIDKLMQHSSGTKITILAPVVRGRKGHYRELFESLTKDGFVRVRVDGEIREIIEGMQVDRYKIHNIEVIVDRIVMKSDVRSRLADAVELALRVGEGVLIAEVHGLDMLFSELLSCSTCGKSYEEPAPNTFSFNSPYGACASCDGLGEHKDFDERLIIPNEKFSINESGITPFGKPRSTWIFSQLKAVVTHFGFNFDTPLYKILNKCKDVLFFGSKEKFDVPYTFSSGRQVTYAHRFEGIFTILKNLYTNSPTIRMREWAEAFMQTTLCNECSGGRLKKESLAIKLVDIKNEKRFSIHDVVQCSLKDTRALLQTLQLSKRKKMIAELLLKEINERLDFLLNLGLNYLSLDRTARTLSGGESQRIRLATQIGAQLSGVLYVLDEPSIGLHQRDNLKLIHSLQSLRDLGNTIIVVEHDKEIMERADYIIDLGPGAGEHGGKVIAQGKPKQLQMTNDQLPITNDFPLTSSLTLDYLANSRLIEVPKARRKGNGKNIVLKECSGNNLKNINVKFPLGTFICVTGVSGSGKSSLVTETLFRILSKEIYQSKDIPLPYKKVSGIEHIDKVIEIDQSPIGRTPRSNPATYTGLFTFIRDLFTQLPESKIRGYKPGRFSFNVKGGRCETCEGDGIKKIEMNFLPDVYVTCEVCNGKRYNRETLEILYKGKSIDDVLEMTVEDALVFFDEHLPMKRKLQTLNDVGLGYIRLGQQATTLSGGEAQRVKLSTELSKVGTGKTLYILDEPTTGLHFEDIRVLLSVLNKLVDKGNTIIVIEHNLDVVKTADYIIDLGPEGGDGGGRIIAKGTPEEIVNVKESYTGKFLKEELKSA